MSEPLSAAQVQHALPGWRVMFERVDATFRTGSFAAGVEFINGVTEHAEAANHHPDIDLRYPAVHISLISHDVGGLTQRDVDLARQISELAAAQGIEVDVRTPQRAALAIDATDIPAVMPFWRAVFAYRQSGVTPTSSIRWVSVQTCGSSRWIRLAPSAIAFMSTLPCRTM